MQKLMTLGRHVAEEQRWHPEATGTFTRLLWDISLAARLVSREVNRAGLADIFGRVGCTNPTGDAQQKLDVFAEERFLALGEGGYLCVMASEEQPGPVPIEAGYPLGNYVLVLDPLDGSSNIETNASLGTVFGIYRRVSAGGPGGEADLLQRGRDLVCAGYVVYGSSTMLVYSAGRGVNGFTLDPSLGEFVLSHPGIRIPERGALYSVNEGNRYLWDDATKGYVDWLRDPDPASGKRAHSLRYIGTMVADFHRTLLTGGVFLYPSDRRDPARPRPKLRLVYEANPIAWLCEQAGGKASAEGQRVVDLQPTSLHQAVPLVVGSPWEVERYEAACLAATREAATPS